MGKTAIVILNWNGLHFLKQFLPLIPARTAALADGRADLIVADNGSTDGSAEWLEREHPRVRLIRFPENYGFTGGYNRAFQVIGEWTEAYDYYLLLNSDVEVTDGWHDTLAAFMDRHPRAGICAPKVLAFHRREHFEHAGACGGEIDCFGFPYCRGRVLSLTAPDRGQYDKPQEVFWASGTSFMIRSGLYRECGGLDDRFFAHMEEIDLCWRAKRLGWQVWTVPDSVIYHVGGGTLPNNSPQKLYLNFRNNLYMMQKNLPEQGKGRRIFARMCLDGAIAAVYLCTGRTAFFRAVVRAHRDFRNSRHGFLPSPGTVSVPLPRTTLIREWLKLRRSIRREASGSRETGYSKSGSRVS